MPTNNKDTVYYFNINIRNSAITNTPNQGLKNGKNAIELNTVAIDKFNDVNLNNYNNTIDIAKCSTAMKRVAWIRSVIDDIN